MASATRLLQVCRRGLVGLVQISPISRATVCDICFHNQARKFSRSTAASGVFEPDGLKLEPDIPEYPTLNVRMRGYDFVLLESYAKYVHSLADTLGFDTESWAVPAKCMEISTFKPNSTVVENKYSLKIYERTIQIDEVPSFRLPILLELMRTHAPEGITFTIKEPDADEEEFRYIPDKEMIELKQQMKAIDDAREERRKK